MTRADIVIVGGGIAGAGLAARVSEFADVVLLEGEDSPGYHATGRSAAMYVVNYGSDVVRALNRASGPALDAAGVLTPRGVLIVAEERERHLLDAYLAEPEVEHVGRARALEMVPILKAERLADAVLETSARDIDVDLLFQGYLKTARANGARLVTRARVTGMRRASDWIVETAAGEFSAPVVVNAAGAWADSVAAMAGVAPLGIQPFRRSVARLPAPGGHDVRGWPMLLNAPETWYAKPDAGKWLVSPAEEDPVEAMDAWADDMVLAEGIARYQEFVTEEVVRIEGSWAGLRSFAPDRTPVVGFDPAVEGFFWLAGQGGYGVQTSPAMSALAAALIGRGMPELDGWVVDGLSPARFS